MTRSTLIVLVLAAACGGTQAPATTTAAEPKTAPAPNGDYTTAEQVMEASLVAQGGRDKLGKLTAMKQTGKLVIKQMGMTGTMTAYSAPPRNALLVVEIPGIGKIAQGTKDDVAWETNPATGARIITGPERATALREAIFNGDLKWKELYPKAELAGVVDWNGQKAYKLVLTSSDGDVITRYFAKDTLLPVGFEATVKAQMGQVPVSMVETDYRDVGGIKFPHKLLRDDAQAKIEITVDTIELSPALDPKTFDLPPEIQALQKKS